MNTHVKTLTTPELIKQQALEISRLNFLNSRLNDKYDETWHPEFGTIWNFVKIINALIKQIAAIDKTYMLKCSHSDMDYDPDCLYCETSRILINAENCVSIFDHIKVERINNATSNTNP